MGEWMDGSGWLGLTECVYRYYKYINVSVNKYVNK